jgi:pimeloyl-ACP methyl ester carboxylesterase
MVSFAKKSVIWMFAIVALTLQGFFSSIPLNAAPSPTEQAEAEQAILHSLRILSEKDIDPRERSRAYADYRSAVVKLLPLLKGGSHPPSGNDQREFLDPERFSELVPIERVRLREGGLHRDGLGLPMVGRITETRAADPNAPRGFVLAATALVLPDSDGHMDLFLADPTKLETIRIFEKELPLAMDLEAWLDEVEATGPPVGAGFRYMLRSDKFEAQSHLTFLQPFDAEKTPVVLIHGLMSTPRMWKPVLEVLLADAEIRQDYQFWFFYYPTGQPVPFSAFQLRQALTDASARYHLQKPVVLVGHSMGGVIARAQVSRISAAEAEKLLPEVSTLPSYSVARNAVVFEPRTDVARIIFIATPHRGSAVATGRVGALGMNLIDLPEWIVSELASLSTNNGQLVTSIHGLSPDSHFLQALDQFRPEVPLHSIICDRGQESTLNGSDGVVPYASSHLDFAASELIIPAGHGGFSHPKAVAEIARILKLNRLQDSVDASK